MPVESVLITGTTSGLGLALLEYYSGRGHSVIAVNRRSDAAIESRFPKARFVVLDISSSTEVSALMNTLTQENHMPDIFFLNAGVNQMDNVEFIDLKKFEEIFKINLFGALTFVEAVQKMRLTGKRMIAISSTSTWVPNAKSLSYYLSKLSLERSFELFSMIDPLNQYQVVLLGPMQSSLNKNLTPQSGVQKKVFDFLTETSQVVAIKCAKFASSSSKKLLPPWRTRAFYLALRIVLLFIPGFYHKPYEKTSL